MIATGPPVPIQLLIPRDHCPGDITGPIAPHPNGIVNVDDLLEVLNNWGACADCNNCPADITGDCAVNVDDLLIVLNNWD